MFTQEMGVDVALNLADLMAHLVAEEMSLGDMITLLKLRRGKYSIVENRVDPRAVASGKPVQDLDLPHECVLTAIFRGGELIIPRGETILQADQELCLYRLSAWLSMGDDGSQRWSIRDRIDPLFEQEDRAVGKRATEARRLAGKVMGN